MESILSEIPRRGGPAGADTGHIGTLSDRRSRSERRHDSPAFGARSPGAGVRPTRSRCSWAAHGAAGACFIRPRGWKPNLRAVRDPVVPFAGTRRFRESGRVRNSLHRPSPRHSVGPGPGRQGRLIPFFGPDNGSRHLGPWPRGSRRTARNFSTDFSAVVGRDALEALSYKVHGGIPGSRKFFRIFGRGPVDGAGGRS